MKPLDSEIRGGLRIDWDVPVEMDDGIVLRADVYHPNKDGAYPERAAYDPGAEAWRVTPARHTVGRNHHAE